MESTIGFRIKNKRKELKLTQKELARKCGVSHVAISQWESNTTTPNAQNLYDLSLIFQCDIAWLLNGKESKSNVISIDIQDSRIPIFKYNDLIGWDSNHSNNNIESNDYIMTNVNVSRGSFALEIIDDSMNPDFTQGDIIIIDPNEQPNPGEFVVSVVNNKQVLFRKYRSAIDSLTGSHIFQIVPLNEDYPTIGSNDHLLLIIGTMIEHRIFRRKR